MVGSIFWYLFLSECVVVVNVVSQLVAVGEFANLKLDHGLGRRHVVVGRHWRFRSKGENGGENVEDIFTVNMWRFYTTNFYF